MQVNAQTVSGQPNLKIISIGTSPECSISLELAVQAWDSQILNRAVAQGNSLNVPDSLGAEEMRCAFAQLVNEFPKLGIEYLTIRLDENRLREAQELQRYGFERLDTIFEFNKKITAPGATGRPLQPEYVVRSAVAADASEVGQLAAQSFQFSRFHSDLKIAPHLAEKIHFEWGKNCCLGAAADHVCLVFKKSHLAGFVSCKFSGWIGLVAVSPKDRGRGLGKLLLHLADQWFLQQGCTEAFVQTQANNFAALDLYRASGFQARATKSTWRWTSL